MRKKEEERRKKEERKKNGGPRNVSLMSFLSLTQTAEHKSDHKKVSRQISAENYLIIPARTL